MEKVIVYIDGPNLLGAVSETLERRAWVDPFILSQRLINPALHEIKNIYYSETPYPQPSFQLSTFKRQQSFFGHMHKAFTERKVVHIKGNYRIDELKVPQYIIDGLAPNLQKLVGGLRWTKPSEKGGDVGLAVRMVRDGLQGNYDHAFLVTEDQDFAPAVRIVMDAGKKVSICYVKNAHRCARALMNRCGDKTGFIQITRGDLKACEIPFRP